MKASEVKNVYHVVLYIDALIARVAAEVKREREAQRSHG
jgi:hypothetical protein